MPHAPHPDRKFPSEQYEAVLDGVAERVAGRKPRRVLELGVGSGALTRRLLARMPGVTLVGVDLASGTVQRATAAVPAIELFQHDLTTLPLPPETAGCDVAAATFLLHELPDEQQLGLLAYLLGESLREGGACVVGDVCVPGIAESHLALDVFVPKAEALGLHVESEQVGAYAAVLVVSGAG